MINTLYSLLFILLAVGAFACIPARAADPRPSTQESATTESLTPESAQSSPESLQSAEEEGSVPFGNSKQTVKTAGGEIQYTSGGIGSDSIEQLKAEEKDYNLKVLFAERGAYLANVKVTIADQRGNTLLDTSTEGPILLVKMPPGTYNITATRASGNTLNQRVKISGNQLSSYVIRFSGVDE